MTSTRLTQQTRSREWAAALRAATHRPYRPNCIARSRQLVARLRRRIQHDTQYIHPVQSSHGNRTAFLPAVLPQGRPCTRPTHAHGWAGGCCLLRSGCADPLPARSCSGGARDRPNPSPRYRTRSICRAEGESETAEPDETLPLGSGVDFFVKGAIFVRLISSIFLGYARRYFVDFFEFS